MRPAALLIALLAALLLAACGGDDGPSREDFVEEADALCERFNEQFEEINEREPQNIEELRELLDEGIEVTEDGLDEFREIEVPDELQDDVDRFLDSTGEQMEILEQARAADSAEEASQVLNEEIPAIREKRQEIAEDIGFEECGRG